VRRELTEEGAVPAATCYEAGRDAPPRLLYQL